MYVGKIAPTLDDEIVRKLLDACGKVKSWKRAQDPETKEPKGFGFCEYEDAEGVLRAIRLLNGLKVDNQELLLKGNTATQKYIEEYERNKVRQGRAEQGRGGGGQAPGCTQCTSAWRVQGQGLVWRGAGCGVTAWRRGAAQM